MKAKKAVFFGLLALAVVPCCAQPYFSCGAGHQESSLGHLAHLGGFAKGIGRGALAGAAPAAEKVQPIVDRFVVTGLTYVEIEAGVSAICKRPENSLISVPDESFLNSARQIAADQAQHPVEPNK
jgi:hypothetical protein